MVAETQDAPPVLPAHIEEAVRSIARFHAEHHHSATPPQRAIARLTALLGQPWLIAVLSVIVFGWISVNLLAAALGYRPLDPPPFPGLGAAISLASLYMMILVLATQRRDDQLAQQREQLTLELALLSEQKTAKVIELLEEFRRDTPLVRNRVDSQAEAMAHPADPQRVLEAIKETHAEAEEVSDAVEGSPGDG
jgi:uncharacterized membrane protein